MSLPPNRRNEDLCRRLGLICAIKRNPRDEELNPDIWRRYGSLDAISYVYRQDDADLIEKEFRAVGGLSTILLEPYGAIIWSRKKNERDGVFRTVTV